MSTSQNQLIIVGVDGSSPAHRAAEAAARIALPLGATLHVVSVFDPAGDRTAREAGFDPTLAAERIAADAASRLAADFPGLSVEPDTTGGAKPGEALVRLAEESNASMIVVGNKRVQGLSRLLGSIAREVATKAPCDVYIAHTHD